MLRTLAFTLLLLALLAVPAQASRSQVTYFEAPRDLLDAGTRDASLDEINVARRRGPCAIVMLWQKVAPEPDVARARRSSTPPIPPPTTGASTTPRSTPRAPAACRCC